MSGVTGDLKIPSRKIFDKILVDYKKIISGFPGFKGLETSGSYNSNKSKDTFGDMDLILQVDGSKYKNDKKLVKKELSKYLSSFSKNIVTPFTSQRYAGKRYYNSGEIITISFKSKHADNSCQIDNIISMDKVEAKFKKDFLDMPAAKQGLILGTVKVAFLDQDEDKILKKLKITKPKLNDNQAIEFNISSKEIQLRKLTYAPNSFKEIKREFIWTSTNWKDLTKILYTLKLDVSFEDLLVQIKKQFKSKRAQNRIAGVFRSMVSIKSGEVGKQKGIDKQTALDLVARTLSENKTNKNSIRSIFKNILNEKNQKNTGLILGRFQPFTKGHEKMLDFAIKNSDDVVLCIVVAKKENLEKNPFPFEIQEKMIKKLYPKIKLVTYHNGYIPEIIDQENVKISTMFCGSDRVATYKSMLKRTGKDNIIIKEIPRTDEDISATKVRESLKNNDFSTFKKLVPKKLHDFFKDLINYI